MGINNNVYFTKRGLSDLKDLATDINSSLAKNVATELTSSARYAIESFYADYTPKQGSINTDYKFQFMKPSGVPMSYRRHYNNFLTNSFFRFYSNPHNTTIRGGVELSYDAMDDIYNISTKYIFQLVYTGHHGNVDALNKYYGNTNRFVPVRMSPSPLQIILGQRRKIINNVYKYYEKAINNINDSKYSTLSFRR